MLACTKQPCTQLIKTLSLSFSVHVSVSISLGNSFYSFIRLVYSKQVCTHHQNSVCVCVCVCVCRTHTHNHYHHPHQSSASFSVCVCLSVSVFNGFMVIHELDSNACSVATITYLPHFIYQISKCLLGRAHEERKKRCRLPREKNVCPRPSTKPGRQKIPNFISAAPARRLPATVAPLPACPRTAALSLALCPPFTHLPWEQNDFDGNLMGIFWELDENKRILIGY
jgi:hypothetical protein